MTKSYKVLPGGLMRCCIATLEERMPTCAEEPKDGERLACRYCRNKMIFRDGAWQWDRD